jgi:excisionase family DNA binding protein
MDNLVLIKTDDLRQLIREELNSLVSKKETEKSVLPPISTKQLCDFLGVTEPTIIRWRKKGKIPFMQIGSAVRFSLPAVISALEVKRNIKG